MYTRTRIMYREKRKKMCLGRYRGRRRRRRSRVYASTAPNYIRSFNEWGRKF